MEFEDVLIENERRKRRNEELERFDPIEGVGCSGDRVEIPAATFTDNRRVFVPREMTEDPKYCSIRTQKDFRRMRLRYDFEYWAATCCRIKHKDTGKVGPFMLNRPQRRVVKMLEEDRRAGRPMRMIVLKARQWGGSTVVEMYMAWLQLVKATNTHAIVCGAEKTGAQVVLNLYSDMLAHYPEELWEGEKKPQLRTHNGIFQLAERDNRVYVAASTNPNAIRGVDAALVHLTEVAYWKSTQTKNPWDAVRAIYCSVAMAPMTMIVLESTADGVGSFFHEEWLRAERADSDFRPVFVAWHQIDRYRLPFSSQEDMRRLWNEMDAYEQALWAEDCLTLEQIHWYHRRRRELKEHSKMQSEFPSNALEAFSCTSSSVFSAEKVALLREDCCEPKLFGDVHSASGALKGIDSLEGVSFREDPRGALHVWELPVPKQDYMISIDIGGLHEKADWSVILVMTVEAKPRVVAQMKLHLDHDLLVWKAAQVGMLYNGCQLVFESNTLESGRGHLAEASYPQGALILNELKDVYDHLYSRPSGSNNFLPGFHTNRSTKQMIITRMVGMVRDGEYTERSHDACDEMNYYERLPSGAYAAREGKHDDLVMARAILLQAIYEALWK